MKKQKLDSKQLPQLDALQTELDCVELEERLEMVQLAALAADGNRCNMRCDAPAK